jgi:hypothetical protein
LKAQIFAIKKEHEEEIEKIRIANAQLSENNQKSQSQETKLANLKQELKQA